MWFRLSFLILAGLLCLPAPAAALEPTPPQGEGPYYPLERPAEYDNDLLRMAGQSGEPDGDYVQLRGTITDTSGMPLDGVHIEIWQTDAAGVYLHPRDPGFDTRDRNFQFFGEDKTDAKGAFSFDTVLPGNYGSRPRHIHVKIKAPGRRMLTTQFYFTGDDRLKSDGLARRAGNALRQLVFDLVPTDRTPGRTTYRAQAQVVLN